MKNFGALDFIDYNLKREINKKFVERVWVNSIQPVENPDVKKQFNKICLASVLKDCIKGFNMPIVKLTACLKRYCVDMGHWSEEELYDFIEKVLFSIKVLCRLSHLCILLYKIV